MGVFARVVGLGAILVGTTLWAAAGLDAEAKKLADEVKDKGRIVYAAKTPGGDWDLFVCRPDGSEVVNLTRTPDLNETWPQISRDGSKLLYRRLGRAEGVEGNRYGEQGEPVLAEADGSKPRVLGKAGELPWACFSPDGKQLATLSTKGIVLHDINTLAVTRTIPRKGFFQQLSWSPDGKSFGGVSNGFGAAWTVARMDVRDGKANVVSGVDCCTPDWFPDGAHMIYSNRAPGQKDNSGYGWTQLWRADADGKNASLVYGEDGRHVYGGRVSPDGKYVVFTGNNQEDGDPSHEGAAMGLIRLADAPMIGGKSPVLRQAYPDAKAGPVLKLPDGFEPCWMSAPTPAGEGAKAGPKAEAGAGADKLAGELHKLGWIVFSAKTGEGDWDLFACRPDGSDRRALTHTPQFNEAGARFSPDGLKLLYFRSPKSEPLDNNTYGTFELMIADSDGGQAVSMGDGYKWATWGPGGREIACLDGGVIRVIDLATRKSVREIPRKGIVEQLVWSPDGSAFVGTANGLGPYWNIARIDARQPGGKPAAVSEVDRYNCTPDWMPDTKHVVYARGIIPEKPGRAELWMASGDGAERQVIYAEDDRHIYGACGSPDGRYVLFTRSQEDLGRVDNSQTSMSVARLADAPVVVLSGDGQSADAKALRARFPGAKSGPRVDLGEGWEPHWTAKDVLGPGSTGGGKR